MIRFYNVFVLARSLNTAANRLFSMVKRREKQKVHVSVYGERLYSAEWFRF